LPSLNNVIPFWNLHFILEMLAKSSKLDLAFCNRLTNDLLNRFSIFCLHKFNLNQNLKTNWHCSLVSINHVFKGHYGCYKYLQGKWVLNIKVTSWPIPIWCGVIGTLVDMNSKDFNLLYGIMNEGLTCSSYFLSNLSLPSTSWLVIVIIGTCIVKVWTGKGDF
jgi:hypothetical protein